MVLYRDVILEAKQHIWRSFPRISRTKIGTFHWQLTVFMYITHSAHTQTKTIIKHQWRSSYTNVNKDIFIHSFMGATHTCTHTRTSSLFIPFWTYFHSYVYVRLFYFRKNLTTRSFHFIHTVSISLFSHSPSCCSNVDHFAVEHFYYYIALHIAACCSFMCSILLLENWLVNVWCVLFFAV